MSHDNVTWTITNMTSHYGWCENMESCMSFLPAAHMAALAGDIYMPIQIGASVLFADKDALKGKLVING